MLYLVLTFVAILCAIDLRRIYLEQHGQATNPLAEPQTAPLHRSPLHRRVVLYAFALCMIYMFGGWLSYL